MSLVGAAVVEGHLCVAGDFQCAGPRAVIGERDSPHLSIRIGRDRDLVAGLDVCITALKHRPVRAEDRLMVSVAPPIGCRAADQVLPLSKSRM